MIQWGLAGDSGKYNALFGLGAQLGQTMRQRETERKTDQALATYASDPADPNSTNALLRVDPRLAIQLRGQQRQEAGAARQQRRVEMGDIAKLFEGVTAENYGQRVRLAQQMGVDVSGVPAQFDPNWVAQQRDVMRFFAERPEALSTAGKQAMDAGLQPGTPEYTEAVRQIITADLAQPYTGLRGETRLYQPNVFGGERQTSGPAPGTVEDGYRFKGGNPADPASWEQVMTNEQGGTALGAAAATNVITPEEAGRVRQSLGPNGQAAFEDWMRRNNVTIGAR